ncbi:hypothetical protein H500_07685 [Helicobacter pylori CG-IMSS-2012]|nr:hypothetical protein H500_07685 [Helicobacter pylori CG-IMSS-2012]
MVFLSNNSLNLAPYLARAYLLEVMKALNPFFF